MSALTKTPANMNMLSGFHATLTVRRLPGVTFFLQNVNVPGISLPSPTYNTPILDIPLPGDRIVYDDIMINYKVDEDLTNYLEIHDWITAIGKKSYEEYDTIADKAQFTGESVYSDLSLTVVNSNRNIKWEFQFHDAFPISMSSLIFDVTKESEDNYIEAAVTFKYTKFDVNRVA